MAIQSASNLGKYKLTLYISIYSDSHILVQSNWSSLEKLILLNYKISYCIINFNKLARGIGLCIGSCE